MNSGWYARLTTIANSSRLYFHVSAVRAAEAKQSEVHPVPRTIHTSTASKVFKEGVIMAWSGQQQGPPLHEDMRIVSGFSTSASGACRDTSVLVRPGEHREPRYHRVTVML